MTVPERWFEADRTNDMVTQYTEDYNLVFLICLFFFFSALFDLFSFCLAVLSE